MFILAIILAVAGLVGLVLGRSLRKKPAPTSSYDTNPQTVGTVFKWSGVGVLVAGLILAGFSSFYTQDVGEANVLRDWTGNVVGENSDSGLHGKAPWIDPVTFNIRNQRVVFVDPKTSTGDNAGGTPDGREINITDADGVNSNVDITVRYSLDPTKVTTIYRDFKTEDGLKTVLIYNDIRSVTRSAAGTFHTLDLLGPGRDEVAKDIQQRLTEKWAVYGVEVDEVSLQQVLAPQSVLDAYSLAQKSQIEVQKATNDLNATKVSAQQKVVQAQADADANAILGSSLTPQILQQRYLDALKTLAAKGNLVVVPEGFNGLVSVR